MEFSIFLPILISEKFRPNVRVVSSYNMVLYHPDMIYANFHGPESVFFVWLSGFPKSAYLESTCYGEFLDTFFFPDKISQGSGFYPILKLCLRKIGSTGAVLPRDDFSLLLTITKIWLGLFEN